MGAFKFSRVMGMAAMAAAVLGAQLVAQGRTDSANGQQAPAIGAAKRVIVVSLEDRMLALVEDGKPIKVYSVAVGKPSTPSPVGTLTIERRVANPTYHHNGKTVLPGTGNPVGTRWMGLSKHGYGIHGTNEPLSIGKAASHGCIRMAKADLEQFYDLVAVGDTVELVGQRNEETAQLFGNSQNPAAPAAQPAQTLVAATTTVLAPVEEPAASAPSTEKAVVVTPVVAAQTALR